MFILYLIFPLKPSPRHHYTWRLLQKLVVNVRLVDGLRYAQSQSRSSVCRWHISFIRSDKNKINQVERMIPDMLEDEGLHVNPTKKGRYIVRKNSKTNWNKFKYLRLLLDTEHYIYRKKGLTTDSLKMMDTIMCRKRKWADQNKNLQNLYTKSKCYPIQLWNVDKSLENVIDTYQCKLLWKVTSVNSPCKIKNERLYERTNTTVDHFYPIKMLIVVCSSNATSGKYTC